MTPSDMFFARLLIATGIFIFVFILYFVSLWLVIRASRNPKSTKLPPGRAYIAVLMLGLSFLVPVTAFAILWIRVDQAQQWSFEQFENFGRTKYQLAMAKIKKLEEWKNSPILEASVDAGRPDIGQGKELRNALDEKIDHVIGMEKMALATISEENRYRHHTWLFMERSELIPLSALLSGLMYAIPCTILGISYTWSLRRSKRKPALIAGVIAGGTWPLILLFVLGGVLLYFLFTLQWWQAMILCFLLAFLVFTALAVTGLVMFAKWKKNQKT